MLCVARSAVIVPYNIAPPGHNSEGRRAFAAPGVFTPGDKTPPLRGEEKSTPVCHRPALELAYFAPTGDPRLGILGLSRRGGPARMAARRHGRGIAPRRDGSGRHEPREESLGHGTTG